MKGPKSLLGRVKRFRAEGHFYSNLLNISLHPEDRSYRLRAAFQLEMKGDGSKLIGHHLFVGKGFKDEPVRSIACEWVSADKETAPCGAA